MPLKPVLLSPTEDTLFLLARRCFDDHMLLLSNNSSSSSFSCFASVRLFINQKNFRLIGVPIKKRRESTTTTTTSKLNSGTNFPNCWNVGWMFRSREFWLDQIEQILICAFTNIRFNLHSLWRKKIRFRKHPIKSTFEGQREEFCKYSVECLFVYLLSLLIKRRYIFFSSSPIQECCIWFIIIVIDRSNSKSEHDRILEMIE